MPINTSTVQAVTNKTTAHNSHICTDVEVIRYRNSAGQILVVQTICIHTELCSRNASIGNVHWIHILKDTAHYLSFLFLFSFLNELCSVEEWASSPPSFLSFDPTFSFALSLLPRIQSSLWEPRKKLELTRTILRSSHSLSNGSLPSPYRILCTYLLQCNAILSVSLTCS